jgi:hypothetical protein
VYILSNRGLRRDDDMLAGGPVSTQPHVTDDDEGDDNPCIKVHTLYIHGTYKSICSYIVHTLYILENVCSYMVHTRAFMFIHCTYTVHIRAFIEETAD